MGGAEGPATEGAPTASAASDALDSDGDGVMDARDGCVDVPEDRDGFEDDDGCPEVLPIRNCQIELSGPIVFEPNKWRIQAVSEPIVDELAATLVALPMLTIEIQNHRDDSPRPSYGHSITDRRAKAVRDQLLKRGIVPERMVSRGYGSSMPLADNRTAEGRRANRRTEIHILRCEELPPGLRGR